VFPISFRSETTGASGYNKGAIALTAPLASSNSTLSTIAKNTSIIRRVFWAANVRSKPFSERLEAAKHGGFSHMSMFPIDYKRMLDDGTTDATITNMIRTSGIKVHVCDPFVQWVPEFHIPEGYPADYVSFISHDEEYIFRMAATLEAEAINCVEGLGKPIEKNVAVDALGGFSERAAKRGLRTCLEFMPISSIRDLAAGWAIIEGINSPNCGLTFDTWHYFRSTTNADLLKSIPAAKIFEVQLADAKLALGDASLTEDLLRYRMLPGEGEFDLRSVVDILKAKGAYTSVGPEVFADAMDVLSTLEAGRKAGASMDKWMI
jgi:sugar phosphate isomerase/epimerase